MDRKRTLSTTPGVTAGQFWLSRAAREFQDQQEARLAQTARASVRRPVSLQALINYGLSYSVPWQVRDLSMTGAFVEMAPSDLREGTIVEFVLRAGYRGRHLEHRFPARATRITPAGVAFVFGPYDDAVYTDLANLLYAL